MLSEPLRIGRNDETVSAKREFWSPKQLAELLGVSPSTIIRMFQDEPGVLKLNEKSVLRRRPHVTLRIPDKVLQRKLRDLSH